MSFTRRHSWLSQPQNVSLSSVYYPAAFVYIETDLESCFSYRSTWYIELDGPQWFVLFGRYLRFMDFEACISHAIVTHQKCRSRFCNSLDRLCLNRNSEADRSFGKPDMWSHSIASIYASCRGFWFRRFKSAIDLKFASCGAPIRCRSYTILG